MVEIGGAAAVNVADSQRERESTLILLVALCAWQVESRATASPAATVHLK
jgi:hypothetical protein